MVWLSGATAQAAFGQDRKGLGCSAEQQILLLPVICGVGSRQIKVRADR